MSFSDFIFGQSSVFRGELFQAYFQEEKFSNCELLLKHYLPVRCKSGWPALSPVKFWPFPTSCPASIMRVTKLQAPTSPCNVKSLLLNWSGKSFSASEWIIAKKLIQAVEGWGKRWQDFSIPSENNWSPELRERRTFWGSVWPYPLWLLETKSALWEGKVMAWLELAAVRCLIAPVTHSEISVPYFVGCLWRGKRKRRKDRNGDDMLRN